MWRTPPGVSPCKWPLALFELIFLKELGWLTGIWRLPFFGYKVEVLVLGVYDLKSLACFFRIKIGEIWKICLSKQMDIQQPESLQPSQSENLFMAIDSQPVKGHGYIYEAGTVYVMLRLWIAGLTTERIEESFLLEASQGDTISGKISREEAATVVASALQTPASRGRVHYITTPIKQSSIHCHIFLFHIQLNRNFASGFSC